MQEHRNRTEIIEVRVHNIGQLFNSFDPSPFPERDLDDNAEEFIVGWAKEFHSSSKIEIRVSLSEASSTDFDETFIEEAINNFFLYRQGIAKRKFQHLMRQGRLSLVIGLVFLAICIGSADLLTKKTQGTISTIVVLGLVIAGWVAMWRPMEIFLYDWWPLQREYRLYGRLARASVKVIARPPS